MIKKVTSIVLMVASIVIMALPYCVPMVWAISPTERRTTYCSYFSLKPLVYGDFAPLIVVVLSFITLAVLIIKIRDNNRNVRAGLLLIICIGVTILSWNVMDKFTWWSFAVTMVHLIVSVLQFIPNTGNT